MDNADIVTRFIRYYGGQITREQVGNDLTPVAPYILMDVAYQSYRKHILPLPVKGRAKQLRGYWASAYNRFNRELFLPFRPEEYDDIIDKMDEVEDFIGEEVKTLENAIVAFLDGKIEHDREVIASILLCNILAQAAQELICISCEKMTGKPAKAPELDSIRIFCLKFANEFLPPEGDINTSEDPAVCEAVSKLSHKIAEWIFRQ